MDFKDNKDAEEIGVRIMNKGGKIIVLYEMSVVTFRKVNHGLRRTLPGGPHPHPITAFLKLAWSENKPGYIP